jgi:ABC-type amino acid transport substrate-binding protein
MPHKTFLKIAFLMFSLCCAVGPALSESVYDRTLKSGKIRAGYVEWFPLLTKDPNTKKVSGIGVDALELAAKRLGLKLELTEEVTWGTMIEGLKSNRYDIIACPVWANSQRARAADFSRPIVFSPICAFTKYGDKRIDSSLKGVADGKFKIACVDGEMAEMIAKADYPNAKRLSLPQMAPISESVAASTFL